MHYFASGFASYMMCKHIKISSMCGAERQFYNFYSCSPHVCGCMGKIGKSQEWSPAYVHLRDVYGYSKKKEKVHISIVNSRPIVTRH